MKKHLGRCRGLIGSDGLSLTLNLTRLAGFKPKGSKMVQMVQNVKNVKHVELGVLEADRAIDPPKPL